MNLGPSCSWRPCDHCGGSGLHYASRSREDNSVVVEPIGFCAHCHGAGGRVEWGKAPQPPSLVFDWEGLGA